MGKKKRNLSQGEINSFRTFRLKKRDAVIMVAESLALCFAITWVFYDSLYGMVLFPVVIFFDYKRTLQDKGRKEKNNFDREFKEMLLAVSDALRSGYSIENAFRDAQENMQLMYGNSSMLLRDLKEMNAKITMRMPAEQAFLEFAEKHPSEEASNFAHVFSFARRLGGEYVKNMRRTIEKMEEKLELKQDINTLIASKQLEFNIMSFMPLAILAYVKLTSGGFLNAMYGSLSGILVMSACILFYVISIIVGRKIVNIEV